MRDANRRNDIWVTHIWTLAAVPGDTAASAYGVDIEQSRARPHRPGDLFEVNDKLTGTGLEQIHKFDSQLTNFQIGYDTGFAPIYDRSGKLVGELGVKRGSAPGTMLGNVWQYLLPPFVATVGFALILALPLSRGVTVPLYSLRAAIQAIGRGNLDTAEPRGAVEFVEMAQAINSMSAGLRERETIKQAFSGYLSRDVLDIIVSDGKLPELKGERRQISVLFADICDFTSISETKRPEEVVELLSDFFEGWSGSCNGDRRCRKPGVALQTATKEFDAEILVSKTTYDAAGSQFQSRALGELHVRGRLQPVQIYGV